MHDEVVRVLGLDTVLRQRFPSGKSLRLEVTITSRRPGWRRRNVTVVGIEQSQRVDQVFVASDEAIPDVSVHQVADAFDLRPRDVRVVPSGRFASTPRGWHLSILHGIDWSARGTCRLRRGAGVQYARVVQGGELAHVNSPYRRVFGRGPPVLPGPSAERRPSSVCMPSNLQTAPDGACRLCDAESAPSQSGRSGMDGTR